MGFFKPAVLEYTITDCKKEINDYLIEDIFFDDYTHCFIIRIDTSLLVLASQPDMMEVVPSNDSAAVVRRIGVLNLMLLAALGGLIRWTLLGSSTELPVLLSVQALHGLTFGAAHLGAMHFIAQAAPAGYSATVQSLYNAIAMSAAIAIAVPLSGPLFEAVGGQAYYAMTVLSVAGGCGVLILRRLWHGDRLTLPEGPSST